MLTANRLRTSIHAKPRTQISCLPEDEARRKMPLGGGAYDWVRGYGAGAWEPEWSPALHNFETALDNEGCEENQHGYDEPDFINSRLFMTSRVYQR
jgi:hypothetical protein